MSLTSSYFLLLQYGSDEFGQDSPRYTSPKAAGLYGDSYYIGECWCLHSNQCTSSMTVVWRRILSHWARID